MRNHLVLGGLAALFLVPTTWADKIYTSSGKVLEDVTIVEEGLTDVVYKDGRNERKLPSEEVLRVTFEDEPRSFGEAEQMLAEDDIESAVGIYSDYVDAIVSGNAKERRHKWAPANAAWRVVGLQQSLGDLPAAAEAAGKLIANFPDSRYLPEAYMAKADAEYWSGNASAAQKTLGDFRSVISDRGLSSRWGIECDLALILTNDELVGKKRRDGLQKIVDTAGSKFKTVANRALVAMGESALADMAAKRGSSKELVAEALGDFEAVIADPLADEATLAGAYAGKGDCLYSTAAGAGDQAKLKEALKSFLRVAAVYPEQARYVPRCLFYAGRCFDLMDGDEASDRAQLMYAQVYFMYPDTQWANEAKNFRRK